MGKNEKLSVIDKLLIAAYTLEEKERKKFSAEDLVVMAWERFPDSFGLAGYYDESKNLKYPDSNRVFAEIMGSKPIRSKGFLAKVGNKMYQLTEVGREQAKKLLHVKINSLSKKAGLSREVQSQVVRLLESKACNKLKDNRVKDITFHDACTFWGISPRSTANDFHSRTSNIKKVVELAISHCSNGSITFQHGSKALSRSGFIKLQELHLTMLEMFKSEIQYILNRTDERAK